MARFGCPNCGENSVSVGMTEHHHTWGFFDRHGNYSQNDSELQDGEYTGGFECDECGHCFGDPAEICEYCYKPIDICVCDECDDCGENENECTCDADPAPTPLVLKKRKHVNPMAKFASDMAKTL